MRLSTSLIYTQGYGGIARQQEALIRTQAQLASGKKITTAGDDPIAATQAQALTRSLGEAGMLSGNVAAAASSLSHYDALLGQVGDLLQSVRTLAVQAGSAALSPADRASLATEAASDLQTLIGLANTRDANGKYLFAGLAVDTQPFVAAPGGVAYSGDQGLHQLQVAPARTLPISVTGSAVFMEAKNGNGAVTSRAVAGNAGSGVVAPASVVTPAAQTGDTYRLQFNVAAGVTTYDVLDVTAGTTVSAGNAYVDGAAISVAGVQTAIRGAPANGDAFTLAPATRQSLFTTLSNLVATLQTPAATPGAATQISNGLGAALVDLDQGLDNVLTLRSGVGSELRELDALDTALSARTLQDEQTLSNVQDLDYNKALTEFAKQQVALQAAQQSFAKVSGLSLFDYLQP